MSTVIQMHLQHLDVDLDRYKEFHLSVAYFFLIPSCGQPLLTHAIYSFRSIRFGVPYIYPLEHRFA